MNAFERAVVACGLVAASAIAAGCSRAQARVVPEMPALDVPAPPPRIIETVEVEEPRVPVAGPTEEGLPVPVKPAPPRPAAQQRAEPKPEPPRVEVPPAEVPRPADETKGPPARGLQTTPATREAELERAIRDMLARANTNLGRVDYAHLSADARTQYDQAKRFVSQAQDELRKKNLVYAENLADKANTLAGQLAGR